MIKIKRCKSNGSNLEYMKDFWDSYMDDISFGIYKPQRILYYIEPTQQEIDDFYLGKLPDVLMAYDGVYGTYDCPGFFRIPKEGKVIEVIGIEFRQNRV